MQIGVKNLEGSSAAYDLGASILTRAKFLYRTPTPGAVSALGSILGVGSNGSTGPMWTLNGGGGVLDLFAPPALTGLAPISSVLAFNRLWYGADRQFNDADGLWWDSVYPNEWQEYYLGYQRNNEIRGIAGTTIGGPAIITNVSHRDVFARRNSYQSKTRRVCGLHCSENTVYKIGPEFLSYEGTLTEVSNDTYSVGGSTAFGSTIWFGFTSPQFFDARDFWAAGFDSFEFDSRNNQGCDAYSACASAARIDTIDHLERSAVLPEPKSLLLLATTLIPLGIHIRRRQRR